MLVAGGSDQDSTAGPLPRYALSLPPQPNMVPSTPNGTQRSE